ERRAGSAAERVVGEPCRATGDGPHPTQLRVSQGKQKDRQRADPPRDDRRRARGDERLLSAEEPAGADDRAAGSPEQTDEADLPAQARTSRSGSAGRTIGNRGLRHRWMHAFPPVGLPLQRRSEGIGYAPHAIDEALRRGRTSRKGEYL